MENQMSQEHRPSRDSSISLEDDIVLSSGQSRSDLYNTRQPQREVYGPVTLGSFLMTPLDLPSTYTAEDSPASAQPPDDGAESSSLSVFRLERYLSEEHYHERFPLGLRPLGVNRATVKRYLPDIIQNMDSDASQAEATRGTMTDCEDRGCRGSTTTTTSTASEASPEPIRAQDSNDAAAALLPLTSFSSHDMAPGLAGLGQTEMALAKPKHAPASSESHLIGPDICEEDLEMRHILMRHRTRAHVKHDKWRVGKQPRVKKTIRLRRRSEELK